MASRPLTAWVNSPYSDPEYKLLLKCGIRPAADVESADIMLFVGGADVNPLLYGEKVMPGTNFAIATDRRDLEGWRAAHGKFKIGICRGGQFLNVMNGGKLWQDVDNHCGDHDLVDCFTGEVVRVSSTHHQMFKPAPHACIVATARETTYKIADGSSWRLNPDREGKDQIIYDYFKRDMEVVYYPDTRSLCFQPHPEYLEPTGTAEYFKSVLLRALKGEYKSPDRAFRLEGMKKES